MTADSDAPVEEGAAEENAAEEDAAEEAAAAPDSGEKPPKSSSSRRFGVFLGIPVIAGLLASAILLVDYLRPLPVYCDSGGGCDAIKHTREAWSFGGLLPTPLIGLVGFLALAGLILARGKTARLLFALAASGAGIFAGSLISAQMQYGVFCKYCMVADLSAIVLMLGATLRSLKRWDPPGSAKQRGLAMAALVPVIAVPLTYGFTKSVDAPEAIRKEMAATDGGKITVVDFVDYECPFCRRTNVALEPILEANASRVRVVRRNVPLSMHLHAMDAAKAACCGQKLGKGEEMTKALLSTDVDELTPEGCAAVASGLGLQPEAFSACVQDPSTKASIDADIEEFHAANGQGLPTIWVDDEGLFGEQTGDMLDRAMSRALKKASGS